jgi:hypothetical protein
MATTTQPATDAGSLAPLPPEIEEEEKLAATARDQSIAALALQDPQAVKAYLEKLEEGLSILRAVAIKSTTPYDWTKYKDRDGNVMCVLRDQGAANIRKWLGISIFNHRGDPLDAKVAGPKVSQESTPDGAKVQVVELWADGFCARTGERIPGIYSAIRSDQKFRGRETLQDDKASVRTYLDTKVTRILSGLRKIPESTLKDAGLDTAKCYSGSGFGNSAERGAGRVAEGGVAEKAKALGDEILRRVGGDVESARSLLVEVSSWKDNGGKLVKGFDSVAKFTKEFQVDNALKALKAHPTFGDATSGEPGAQG